MSKSDFWAIMGLQWALFAAVLYITVLMMSADNLHKELEYMQNYKNVVTSSALQDVMCNGNPA